MKINKSERELVLSIVAGYGAIKASAEKLAPQYVDLSDADAKARLRYIIATDMGIEVGDDGSITGSKEDAEKRRVIDLARYIYKMMFPPVDGEEKEAPKYDPKKVVAYVVAKKPTKAQLKKTIALLEAELL